MHFDECKMKAERYSILQGKSTKFSIQISAAEQDCKITLSENGKQKIIVKDTNHFTDFVEKLRRRFGMADTMNCEELLIEMSHL